MWNAKTKVVPVIIMANGTISKPLRKCVSSTPGKTRYETLQKNIPTEDCVHTSQSINVKVQDFVTGNNITHISYIKHRTAVILYTLETLFIAGT
jgi:hypothetical protein